MPFQLAALFKLTVNKYDIVLVGNKNRCYYRDMLVEDRYRIYSTIQYISSHICNFPKDTSFIMVLQMGRFHYSITQYYRMWSFELTMIIVAHFN